MSPTRPRVLLLAALAALAVALLASWAAGRDALLELPAPAAVVVGVVALLELPLAASVRARLAGRPRTRPILPLTVARVAALAQASSRTGALAAGVWLALLLDRLSRLGGADAVRRDAVVAGVGLGTALLLVAAGLRLEGVCRVQDPPRPGAGGPGRLG